MNKNSKILFLIGLNICIILISLILAGLIAFSYYHNLYIDSIIFFFIFIIHNVIGTRVLIFLRKGYKNVL